MIRTLMDDCTKVKVTIEDLQYINTLAIYATVFTFRANSLQDNRYDSDVTSNGAVLPTQNDALVELTTTQDYESIKSGTNSIGCVTKYKLSQVNGIGLLTICCRLDFTSLNEERLTKKPQDPNSYEFVSRISDIFLNGIDCYEREVDWFSPLIGISPHGAISIESNQKILCNFAYRIPYKLLNNFENEPIRKVDDSHERAGFWRELKSVGVQCKQCHQALVPEHSFKSFRHLPSGIFDSIIHDFICCENDSCNPMTTQDIVSQPNVVLYGVLYLTIHPNNALQLHHKLNLKFIPTLIDLFVGHGGLFATSPISLPPSASSTTQQKRILLTTLTHPIVNIDTCSVSCGGCGAYVGDAQIVVNEDNQAHDNGIPVDDDPTLPGFSWSDVQSLRYDKHCITVIPSKTSDKDLDDIMLVTPSKEHPSIPTAQEIHSIMQNIQTIDTEEAVASVILHLNASFSSSSFILYATQPVHLTGKAETKPSMNSFEVVRLRIMNADIKLASKVLSRTTTYPSSEDQQPPEADGSFLKAIKFSFIIGEATGLMEGKEARIALTETEYKQVIAVIVLHLLIQGDGHDVIQVKELIINRSACYGNVTIPFKNRNTSELNSSVNETLLQRFSYLLRYV